MTWIVEVVDYTTDEVVKRIECTSERAAERVENGLLINMNLDQYTTQIIEVAIGQSTEKPA